MYYSAVLKGSVPSEQVQELMKILYHNSQPKMHKRSHSSETETHEDTTKIAFHFFERSENADKSLYCPISKANS